MNAPLARHLTRFSAPAVAAASAIAIVAPEQSPERTLTMTVAAYEGQVLEASAQARALAEAEGAATLAQARAAHVAALAAEVAAAEARAALALGEAVADRIASAVAAMRDEIATQVAAALRPLVDEAVIERAVVAVAETLARALADPDHPALAVRGPAPILAAIEARLGAPSGLSFAAEEGDVFVSGNGIRIEARLAEALAAICDMEAGS